MSIGSILGDIALGLVTAKLEAVAPISPGASKKADEPTTAPFLRPTRQKIDAYFEANAKTPLAECKEEILQFMNEAIGLAYQRGGKEMLEGLEAENGVTFR